MYASSARVKAGFGGVAVGCEVTGLAGRPVVVASRLTPNATTPSKARTVPASALPLALSGHGRRDKLLAEGPSRVPRNPLRKATPLRPICFLACRAEGRNFSAVAGYYCQ